MSEFMETTEQPMSVKIEREEEGFDVFLQEFLFTTKADKEEPGLLNDSKSRSHQSSPMETKEEEISNLTEHDDTGSPPRGKFLNSFSYIVHSALCKYWHP